MFTVNTGECMLKFWGKNVFAVKNRFGFCNRKARVFQCNNHMAVTFITAKNDERN